MATIFYLSMIYQDSVTFSTFIVVLL